MSTELTVEYCKFGRTVIFASTWSIWSCFYLHTKAQNTCQISMLQALNLGTLLNPNTNSQFSAVFHRCKALWYVLHFNFLLNILWNPTYKWKLLILKKMHSCQLQCLASSRCEDILILCKPQQDIGFKRKGNNPFHISSLFVNRWYCPGRNTCVCNWIANKAHTTWYNT